MCPYVLNVFLRFQSSSSLNLEKLSGFRSDTFGEKSMIIDLHVHTDRYSQCSSLSPESAIMNAKSRGLDGICFMEHNAVWDRKDTEELSRVHDFLVVRGMEVGTDMGHILVFGMEQYEKQMNSIMALRSLVKAGHGTMIAAHPFRRPLYPNRGYGDWALTISPQVGAKREIFSMIDGLEVFNGRSSPIESLVSLKVSKDLGLMNMAGSDAHCPEEVGKSATFFPADIHNEDDFLKAVRNCDCYGVHFG